jgi:hypothetical protein
MYSAGLSALRRLRPVLWLVRRPRRRVQPPLLRLRAVRAAHEPRVKIDSQCNVYTPICVQYRVGATKKQRYRRTQNSISKHKASISYTDIEGAFVDIDKSSISGYSSDLLYRCFFDIELRRYRSSALRYRRFFDIVLDRYRMLQHSISKFIRF